MKTFVLVLLILSTLVVATSACEVGEILLQSGNAIEYDYGTYTGFKQEVDLSVDAHLCFYVPNITKCPLIDDDFLSCEEQSSCTQYERKDVINIHDNETMRIIIANFRMMPPDDELDEAFVIRLYSRTVVWLAEDSCWDPNRVLSPRIYTYSNLSDCTTNPTTTLPDITMSCPVCSMTASPTTTSIHTDTPTVAEASSRVVAGISIPSGFIIGVVAGSCITGFISIVVFKKCLKRKPTVSPEQNKEESYLTGKKRLHDSGDEGEIVVRSLKRSNTT